METSYQLARERFMALGVDPEAALERLSGIPVSLHCWQGDDVNGFENLQAASGGGLMATGNYPGRASTPGELREDLEQALRLLPGRHRVNLHAMYLDADGKEIDRDALAPVHFESWKDWARAIGVGVDFNPTFFAHPKADTGFTLASPDPAVRDFWIEHGRRCREIGAWFGRELGTACTTNFWVPDGYKDIPADRFGPRRRLAQSLDAIFAQELDPGQNIDAVESKLFGIGSEAYVAGSHEFYLAYAIQRGKWLCLDAGHFHPTESIADKISALIDALPGLLLHVSRGVRWDSDHVVIQDDELAALGEELVRSESLDRIRVGLDFFDASINRIAAWVIGTRNTLKALLRALLQPMDQLRRCELEGNHTERLALLEEWKTLPWGVVWEMHCQRHDVAGSFDYLPIIRDYERRVLSKRPG